MKQIAEQKRASGSSFSNLILSEQPLHHSRENKPTCSTQIHFGCTLQVRLLWPRWPQRLHVTLFFGGFSAEDGILFSLGRPRLLVCVGGLKPSSWRRPRSTGTVSPAYVSSSSSRCLSGMTNAFGCCRLEMIAAHMCRHGMPCSRKKPQEQDIVPRSTTRKGRLPPRRWTSKMFRLFCGTSSSHVSSMDLVSSCRHCGGGHWVTTLPAPCVL